ncbi:MAG: prephenate dehydrogenase/arogenate dehydrogenase family protein [Betaproteobacteria bacterium]|nr:prephenate dehydrogenase/arogenate dehydrogenase family protein [Betaproteobacteria bacterium]
MAASGFKIDKLVIIGAGLIGGSFALALKRAGAVRTVTGIGRSQATLQRALQLGVIDQTGKMDRDALAGANLIMVATPVGQMRDVLGALKLCLAEGTIVTDGGSTKQDVVTIARESLGSRFAQFVPGHPIAGTERSGPEAAFAELFDNRRVVLTPVAETAERAVMLVQAAWEACRAQVTYLTPRQHDTVFAAVSHLPHLLSFALVEELAAQESGELLFSFAGGGFRDFTRIASSNPEMWRDISLANREALGAELRRYRASLDNLQQLLDAGDADALGQVFERAQAARERWLKSKA